MEQSVSDLCVCVVRYAPRCRCEYRISVQLLDHKNVVVQDFTPDIIYLPQFDEQIGEQWHQVRTKCQV